MYYFIFIYIFIIGTLFGSFGSVIIDRLKNKKSGILTGRSECPNCKHKLGIKDLFPIFSFLFSKGKCRYCNKKISFIYPVLELVTGILFVLISYYLVNINLIFSGDIFEISKLFLYLTIGFFSIIYVFYDILYLEIPENILFILIGIVFLGVSFQTLFGYNYFEILPLYNLENNFSQNLILVFVSFFVIVGYYIIMTKGLKEIYDIVILLIIGIIFLSIKYLFQIDLENTAIGSAILASFFVFLFLFLQILVSSGAWLGGGDLRIGILLGLLLGLNFSMYGILFSYLFGSLFGVGLILYVRIKNYYLKKRTIIGKLKDFLGINKNDVKLNSQIPFGPFLAIGMFLVLFYSNYILLFIENYL